MRCVERALWSRGLRCVRLLVVSAIPTLACVSWDAPRAGSDPTGVASVADPGGLPVPEITRPESLRFDGPPAVPELRAAWMLGAENAPGPYALRVRLAAGGRIPPHTHPDPRHTVVLSGTLYVGFGEQSGTEELVAVPAGAVYVTPAGVPHYVWAREGDVEYQENGVGPTGTRFVSPP